VTIATEWFFIVVPYDTVEWAAIVTVSVSMMVVPWLLRR
jgi:hypothetical protein